MWKIETKYLPGNPEKTNEDAYVINEKNHIYAAIDGATGLKGIPGYFASYALRDALSAENSQLSLRERIELGNESLAAKTVQYYNEHYTKVDKIDDVEKNNRSSTGLAAIQFSDDGQWIDYSHAGDCMLFLQYENGDIRTVTYDLIQYLDGQVVAEMVRLRSLPENENLSVLDIREQVKHMLLKNRNCLNTAKGYGIIDGSKASLEQMEYGRLSLRKVKKILLLSDGFTYPVTNSEEDEWLISAEIAFESGLDVLLEDILQKENSDPNCVTYPRLKKSDDKTGILLELSCRI